MEGNNGDHVMEGNNEDHVMEGNNGDHVMEGNNEDHVEIDINYDEIPEAEPSNLVGLYQVFKKNGMLKIEESTPYYKSVKNRFRSGMGPLYDELNIVAIHYNSGSSSMSKARLDSFNIFQEAVAEKRSGHGNMWNGWYGVAKDEIQEILCHGFCRPSKVSGNGETYGRGVYLSSVRFPLESVLASEEDEFGLRHLLFCRVILGNVEKVPTGSDQFRPSEKGYDSGVDNLDIPYKRCIVWGCSMNTHICIKEIVSFRFPCYEGSIPASPLRVTTIIKIMSNYVDHPKMTTVSQLANDLQANKITWSEFELKVAEVCGFKLWNAILKIGSH